MPEGAPSIEEAASTLGLRLDGVQRTKLYRFAELLVRVNGTHNLSAARGIQAVLQDHLFDCMAVVPAINRECGGRPLRLLDVGSGSGLPGLVLAICIPNLVVTCVDAVGKKAEFLALASRSLELQVVIRHASVERLQELRFDMVVSRAFSSLKRLVELTSTLLAPTGQWAAMKGQISAEELADVRPRISGFHVEQVAVPFKTAVRCLVWMSPPFVSADDQIGSQ